MKQIVKQLVMVLALLTLVATSAMAAEVAFWGSTTCQKRFLEPGSKALEQETGVKTRVFGVGSGKGLLALLEGKTNVAITSNDLAGTIKSAQKVRKKEGKGEASIPANLQFHEITSDIIVPIVNKANTVSSLTWQQLSDINTGKITNWKDVGGSDMAIKVITSHAGSATRAVFQKKVMKKADYVANKVEVKSTRIEINEVSKAEGGIGAVSAGFFKLNPGKTKQVQTDTIARPLALITIGDPAPEVQKVIDFYRSDAGKKYIVN